jgi:hypothetical protein
MNSNQFEPVRILHNSSKVVPVHNATAILEGAVMSLQLCQKLCVPAGAPASSVPPVMLHVHAQLPHPDDASSQPAAAAGAP